MMTNLIDHCAHSGVYYLLNTANNKMYVGQSSNIELRILGHVSALSMGAHPNQGLQNDWFDYGRTAFEANILVTAIDKAERLKLENSFIHTYQTLNAAYGYNLPPGKR